ncbi:MAG: (2Fe-2S) ferredoxin domain-containing protein, partial [Oscillospiraceae bacterium]|nr:(2Fe-2S) ferredoxin domain-containing protein [Oscillospiraceae bacterium]
MKSLEELKELRDKMQPDDKIRVVVGLATCGIAAGAKPVLEAVKQVIEEKKLTNVRVFQTGCVGLCQYEPIMEVIEPGKDKVTYVKMDADKARTV